MNVQPNWRRGLLRVWIVLSICWVGLVAELAREDFVEMCTWTFDCLPPGAWLNGIRISTFPPGMAGGPSTVRPVPDQPEQIPGLSFRLNHFAKYALAAVAPPIGALLLWVVVAWIVAGFSRRPGKSERDEPV
jgi:hypothetical protein